VLSGKEVDDQNFDSRFRIVNTEPLPQRTRPLAIVVPGALSRIMRFNIGLPQEAANSPNKVFDFTATRKLSAQ
jgi:hypothetical protein